MKKRVMKDQGGFTLVELIVVLVILAILAAILVPALLGYIDRARNGQYLEEAHSIYTAVQVVDDEAYAKGATHLNGALTASANAEINKMVEPTVVTSVNVTPKGTTKEKDKYTVGELKLTFTSQNGKTVSIDMNKDGSWGDPTITSTP